MAVPPVLARVQAYALAFAGRAQREERLATTAASQPAATSTVRAGDEDAGAVQQLSSARALVTR